MKVLLDCFSTDPEYKGGCQYALVDLTPELARKIQQRIQFIQDLHNSLQPDLWHMTYLDDSATYIGTEDPDTQPKHFPDSLDSVLKTFNTAAQLPDGFSVPGPYHALSENAQMIVTAHGDVFFYCYPGQSEYVEITTAAIPANWIEQMDAVALYRLTHDLTR